HSSRGALRPGPAAGPPSRSRGPPRVRCRPALWREQAGPGVWRPAGCDGLGESARPPPGTALTSGLIHCSGRVPTVRRALTITLIALLAALAPTLGTEPATADPVPVET